MQFTMPTTKEEMHATLEVIFEHYRTIHGTFISQPLAPLELARMEYTPPTDQELLEKAERIVAADHKREVLKRKDDLTAKLQMLNTKIEDAQTAALKEIEEVEKLYAESARKVELQSMKNGLVGSGIVVDKLTSLEEGKNQKIADINAQKNGLVADYNSQKMYTQNQIDSCETYYEQIHEDEVAKALDELKEQREKTVRQVFEYNSGQDEKEQRYENQIIKHNASVELRYLEISGLHFSKNQLIEMGYYKDVMACVMGYYNTLEPLTAWREVAADETIKIYLEDYYEQVLVGYESLAGM